MPGRRLPTDVSLDVSLGRGITLDFHEGETVVFDGSDGGDVPVLSHAHGDHTTSTNPRGLVCSPLTAALATERRNLANPLEAGSHPDIDLRPAGHVAGSRAAYVTDPASGRTVCYTGDVCTRDRLFLDGFDPQPADDLVIETTYGSPEYRLPPTDEVFADIRDWLRETMDRVVLLYGYALGRAQKLQMLATRAGRDRVFVTDAVADVNRVIEAHRDVSFAVERLDADVDLRPGDAVVLPPHEKRRGFVDGLVGDAETVDAGFSGWAVDSSYRYRRGYDVAFPLSDHCDFDELTAVVEAVDPERVFTHHGFADEFARHVTAEFGVESRALKRDQHTLADF
jgi:putative mRNA 3-end processing factor